MTPGRAPGGRHRWRPERPRPRQPATRPAADARRRWSRAAPPASAAGQARRRAWPPRAGSLQLLAAERARAVEALHRALDTLVQRQLERVRDAAHDVLEARGLGLGEAPQHIRPA